MKDKGIYQCDQIFYTMCKAYSFGPKFSNYNERKYLKISFQLYPFGKNVYTFCLEGSGHTCIYAWVWVIHIRWDLGFLQIIARLRGLKMAECTETKHDRVDLKGCGPC